jgi:hypothetical protein
MSIARFEWQLLSASIRKKTECSVRFIALPEEYATRDER